MTSTVHVSCDGYGTHSTISFELDVVEIYGSLDANRVSTACPVCSLTASIQAVEGRLNEAWEAQRKAKDIAEKLEMLIDKLLPMHDWWKKTCAIEKELQKPDPAEQEPAF